MRFYSSWQEIQTQSWVRSETTFIWGQRYIIMQKRRKSLVWKDSPEVRKQRWANENKLKISRFESCWDVIEFKVFRHSVSVIIFFWETFQACCVQSYVSYYHRVWRRSLKTDGGVKEVVLTFFKEGSGRNIPNYGSCYFRNEFSEFFAIMNSHLGAGVCTWHSSH